MWNVKRQLLNFWNIKLAWKLEIVVSIITRFFLVYIFVDCSESVSCLLLLNFFLSVNVSLPCFLQRSILFLMFWRYLCSYIAFLLKDGSIPMIFMWYFSRGDYNTPLSTAHFCSNVSIEITESITLVIILDLIHLEDWEVLPSFWKHIYYLPTGGNTVGVFKINILEGVEAIRCVRWLGV